jgi:hypothetical protein
MMSASCSISQTMSIRSGTKWKSRNDDVYMHGTLREQEIELDRRLP